ncbi:MAG: ABC transporter ATP-binding protein [archaeon]
MEKQPLITFSHISKSFGNKRVIDNLDLTIDKGDIFGILGPSGSGKSTLMKILLGKEIPDSGSVEFDRKDITGNSNYLKKITGLTTQDNSFYDKLTVMENMLYYSNLYSLKMNRKQLDRHIHSLLDSVKLRSAKDSLAGKLSGGMKRRLDFALSLLHDPQLLVLDEPTTGLDPLLVEEFWKIIRETAKKGKTILVISHIFPEIKANCNKVGILNKGTMKIIEMNHDTDLMKEFEKVVVG